MDINLHQIPLKRNLILFLAVIFLTWLSVPGKVQAGYCYVNATPDNLPTGWRWELYCSSRGLVVTGAYDSYPDSNGSYDEGDDLRFTSRTWTLKIYFNDALIDTKVATGASVTMYVTVSNYLINAPTGVSASNGDFDDKIVVSWSAVTGASFYEIWRSTNSVLSNAALQNTVSTTQFMDTSALINTTYYYWVKAINAYFTSDASHMALGQRGSLAARYVSPSGTAVSPYITWHTAARDIQTAVNAANPGELVLVTNGNYLVSQTVTVTKLITVRSVSGPSYTTINGGGNDRCVYIDGGGIVDGFTITGGYIYTNKSGAGAAIGSYGFLKNSIISDNVAVGFCKGGGFAFTASIRDPDQIPEVRNCIIKNNTATWGGGVCMSDGGVLRNCLIVGNSASAGGVIP